MNRRKGKKNTAVPIGLAMAAADPAYPSSALKKESGYGHEPWKPGELPVKGGSLRKVIGRLDDSTRTPYGEYLGVQKINPTGGAAGIKHCLDWWNPPGRKIP